MTAPDSAIDEPSGAHWRHARTGDTEVWLTGHVRGREAAVLASELDASAFEDAVAAGAWVRGLDGHFALLARGSGWALGAVDRVRSTPLFYAAAGRSTVGADADAVRRQLGLSRSDIDCDAALSVGMCGYTIGDRTLYASLRQLRAGEVILLRSGRDAETVRYASYRPWLAPADGDERRLEQELLDVTRLVLERLVESVEGRTIVVPLSAGLDSRLIVSGLAALGHRDVRCFAYGQPGNYEVAASRAIAEQLGYPWRFLPLTRRAQRATFSSAEHAAYLQFADSLSSVPFEQDLGAVLRLREEGWLPPDSVIVNGNTGDYLSGNHVPPALGVPLPPDASPREREDRVLELLLAKHARLWTSLATPEHDAVLAAMVRREWQLADVVLSGSASDHGAFEAAELIDRQCKYVISGQRVYEFLGFDWRLPLWDTHYLDFWERVPVGSKIGQRLYRTTLVNANWGGVWESEPAVFTTPRWVVPAVKIARAAHGLRPRRPWPEVERRWFNYWTDLVNNHAVVPWRTVVSDRRGHRNAISWHAAAYLASKGLDIDGSDLT